MTTDIQSAIPAAPSQEAAPAPQATPADDVGFRPVPTRIQDLAPIVAENDIDATTKVAVCETLDELGQKLAGVHRTAAEAYLSQNMYDEALPHLRAAATFAPDCLEYHNQVGFVSFIAGADDEAIASFERVLGTDPNQIDALFNLGMVQFGQENWMRAAECFDRVLQITPQDAEAWNNLGAALCQGGHKDKGIECFRKTLEIDPQNEDAIANLQALGA